LGAAREAFLRVREREKNNLGSRLGLRGLAFCTVAEQLQLAEGGRQPVDRRQLADALEALDLVEYRDPDDVLNLYHRSQMPSRMGGGRMILSHQCPQVVEGGGRGCGPNRAEMGGGGMWEGVEQMAET
jgi:hypothetical protein